MKEVTFIEEILRTISLMGFSGLRDRMVKFMRENGRVIKKMVRDTMNGQMAAHTKVITKTISAMVTAPSNTPPEKFTMVNGRME